MIKLLKPPALGSLPTCWPALPLDLPQDLLFWRPFWQRVVDNGNNWYFYSIPSCICNIWSRIVRSNTTILLQMFNETLHNRCAGSSLTWVDFLAWETLDQHRFFSNVKRAAEIVKGCSFHCITPSVIITVALKAFGAWLPQEFALDWEFHDKVSQFKYFSGGYLDNFDSKDSSLPSFLQVCSPATSCCLPGPPNVQVWGF